MEQTRRKHNYPEKIIAFREGHTGKTNAYKKDRKGK